MMTLEQFRASGRDVQDVSTIEQLDSQGFSGPGRVYADDMVIMGTPGQWCLTISHDSQGGPLDALERSLYEWAISAGHLV